MDKTVLAELLPSLIMLMFIIMVIALVIKRKTKYPLTQGEYIMHKISKVVFWVLFIILFPIILIFSLELGIGFIVLWGLATVFSPIDIRGGGTSNSSYHSSNQNTRRTVEPEKQEEPKEKRYCHCGNGKVSTIYRNNVVVRSDGVTGYRTGNYIHYNDGTTGYIVMLNDNQGIIE